MRRPCLSLKTCCLSLPVTEVLLRRSTADFFDKKAFSLDFCYTHYKVTAVPARHNMQDRRVHPQLSRLKG